MFVGAVPQEVISQVLATVPFDEWGSVYVGCSGSFRFDRAVKKRHPKVRVFSNDVSLLTCSIGELAMKRSFQITFKGDLEFVEPLVGSSFRTRVGAVMVACAMGKFTGKNDFARMHFRHYRENFAAFVEQAVAKLDTLVAEIVIEDYYPGDFLLQADRAAEHGGGVAAFAPTYAGGYERIYRLVNQNTEWPQPAYGIWNPKSLPTFIRSLEDRQIPYCVISDQLLPDRTPVTEWRGSNKPVYTYANARTSSFRRRTLASQPFKYKPVDPAAITASSKIEVAEIDNKRMTFLKNVYLAKGIEHTTGHVNVVVLIDGAIAGGFSYTSTEFGDKTRELYLLSDFSTTRDRRVSKLIPMIATSRDVINPINRRMLIRVERVSTTAFTTKPVSMKYRGIFELDKRTPDHLQYGSNVRDQSLQEVFNEWHRKFAGPDRKADRPREAEGPDAARAQRPVHDAPAVQSAGGEHQG